MSGNNAQIDFDLPEEIKVQYASQVQDATKSFQKFQEQLELVASAHKNVLEENIKLRAVNEALNKEVQRLSCKCNDNNNVPNNEVFSRTRLERKDCSDKENFNHNDLEIDEDVIGASPEKPKSKTRASLSVSKVTEKSCSDESLEGSLGKCLSLPVEKSQKISKTCWDTAHLDKYEAEQSFSETYLSNCKAKENFDNTYFLKAKENVSSENPENSLNPFDTKDVPCVHPSARKYSLLTYDRLPETSKKDCPLVYQESRPIRKKADKAKLKGFVCENCCDWFNNCGLSEKEKETLIQKCSKHRGKCPQDQKHTPESFWDPLIKWSSSEDV